MGSNYAPIHRNTLDGLSETAGFLYMTLVDAFQGHTRGGERRAFLAACDYDDKCGSALDHIMRRMPGAPSPEVRSLLSKFFAERWRHNFMEVENG